MFTKTEKQTIIFVAAYELRSLAPPVIYEEKITGKLACQLLRRARLSIELDTYLSVKAIKEKVVNSETTRTTGGATHFGRVPDF